MYARLDVLGAQNLVLCLIRGACGNDVCTLDGFFGGGADSDVEAQWFQVAANLLQGLRVYVVDTDVFDAQVAAEAECLEFSLRTGADHGHGLGIWAR